MSNITLQLDNEALREATVQAMLGVLTPEVKAKILESAVQEILKPSTNSWDKGKSPIEVAFQRAIETIAKEEAIRMVSENEEVRDKIKKLMLETAVKVIETDTDKLALRMADAFVDSIRRN